MRKTIAVGAAVVFLSVSTSPASDVWRMRDVRVTLSDVPPAELPAKAAELIKSAKAKDRSTTIVKVVRAAIKLNPAAASAIAGAAAQSAPAMASIVAATAVNEQPRQAGAISRAAATAAPSQAGEIVIAACRTMPGAYRDIALCVAQAVPASIEEVLKGVAAVFPDLGPGIETALKASAGKPLSVAGVLDSARLALLALPDAPPIHPAPTGGGAADRTRLSRPPFIPLSGNPGQLKSSASGTGSEGGRNYATP